MADIYRRSLLLVIVLLTACASQPPSVIVPVSEAVPVIPVTPGPQHREPKIALVLGGGAARGFAQVGVIKGLEAQGIKPDIIVGTSAGSLVGALYAGGENANDLQTVALQIQQEEISDWALPNRGVFKGEALQKFVNAAINQRPLEKLNKTFAVVATDLHSGEMVVFRTGDTGMAVRASSAVPGVFQPVSINGHEYVDGGLTSPVPVRVARSMGADFIIAVDVSTQPQYGKTKSSIDVVLQTFAIMEQGLARNELPEANVVVRPHLEFFSRTDFQDRKIAIQAGEQAAAAALTEIKIKLAELREKL